MKWINKYWSVIGGMVAFGIIVTIFLNGEYLFSTQSLFWIHLAVLLLHQFEEYSIPGGFKQFYNSNIWNKNPITRFELNDKGILIVNVVLAWIAYFLAALYGDKLISLTIGLLGVTILNGIMHTLMFCILRKYNPGLITGLFVFIPFGILFLTKIQENIELENWITGIIIFVIGTALIPVSIKLTNRTT